MLPQPLDEGDDICVPPHPGRKALEILERFDCALVLTLATNVLVYAVRIGPVRFDDDRAEPALNDQLPGDMRAVRVELVRAMAGLAEQRQLRVADEVDRFLAIFNVADRRGDRVCRVL